MQFNEQKRLEAVRRFEHFNFDLDKNLQGVLQLAADIYETPVAFITLIDEKEQWFKVNRGFEVKRMPRDTSFCTHVVRTGEVMIVNDAGRDTRFSNNPLVSQPPYIRFYAGAPLATNDGHNIGTLCVMDTGLKEITDNKKLQLGILAQQAIHLMELKLTYQMLNEKADQIARQNKVLLDIAFIQSHEFRGPLSTIMGLMNAIKDEEYQSPREYLELMDEAIQTLDEKIHIVVRSTDVIKSAYLA
jgi:GAF domain-containing protein